MNRFYPFFLACLLTVVFIFTRSIPLRAYTEEIEASFDEVFKATEEVLKPYGINKSKPEKKYIESKWIEDHVVRPRQLLPFNKLKATIQQSFDRRYRMTVKWEEASPFTRIAVKGNFQTKPAEFHPGMSWRPVKPRLPESTIERDFFFKILRQIENNRLKTSPQK